MADQPDHPRASPETAEPQPQSEPQPDTSAEDIAARRAQRRRWLMILIAVVAVIGAIVLLYHFLIGVKRVSTDNAYVGADTAQITPLVAGAVSSVRVMNTQFVHKGDILVTIDSADAHIAADRAAADLAQARRELLQTRANGGALSAQLTARGSDIARAQAELVAAQAQFDKARIDLDRREKLAASGAVSGDELTSARTAFANARAQVAVARAGVAQAQATRAAATESLAANRALTQGSAEQNPDVAAARARFDAAQLDLSRTVIRAPIDGIVAQRMVQIGQRIATGAAIMTIVPTGNMYVDANFKEGQLRKVKLGQAAELTSDLYGGSIVFHGKVIGFSGGSARRYRRAPGSSFNFRFWEK